MPTPDPSRPTAPNGARDFRTTRWSVVLAAGRDSTAGAQAALEQLCRVYWYPLYLFVRRQGPGREEARDLTQGFFAHLLAGEALGRAEIAQTVADPAEVDAEMRHLFEVLCG